MERKSRQPVNAVKGEIYQITLTLWKTAYIVNLGHILVVDVSSSNHPRFEKNLNNGKLLVEGGLPVTAIYFIDLFFSQLKRKKRS